VLLWDSYRSALLSPHHTKRRPRRPHCVLKISMNAARSWSKWKNVQFSNSLTSLLRPGQVLTAPNTSLSGSYYVKHVPANFLSRALSRAYHVQCALTTFLLRPIRSHHVLNTHLPRSHCVHPVLINNALRAAHFHSFC